MIPEADGALEERLAPRAPPYKSAAEAKIGRLLDYLEIPFFYRQPKLVWDQGQFEVYYPCFSTPIHDRLVVDYAGAPDIWDAEYRRRVYEYNRIPSVIVYPHELTGTDWPDRLAARVLAAGPATVVREEEPTQPCWREDPIRRIQWEYQRARAEYRHWRTHSYTQGDYGSP